MFTNHLRWCVSLCKDTLLEISLQCSNALLWLIDQGGVSQKIKQENPITFIFLSIHCDMHPEPAFDYRN